MTTEELRYGENPHQSASVTANTLYEGPTILRPPLHGKPLSFNNIQDADAVLQMMLDLVDDTYSQRPAAITIKHKNPCGAATGDDLAEAVENSWRGDEVSAFGSIIGLTQEATLEAVQALKGRFVEVLVAPGYKAEALEWIKSPQAKKKNMRVIATGDLCNPLEFEERHYIRGGFITQTSDNKLHLGTLDGLLGEPQQIEEPNTEQKYTVGTVSEAKYDSDMKGLVEFSIIAAKHTRSNAITICYEYEPGKYRVLGMGAGQPNRMDSGKKLAITKANENLVRQLCREKGYTYSEEVAKNPGLKLVIEAYQRKILSSPRVVAASDALFPFRDGVDALANMGIKYVLSPGGSKRDDEVIQAANEHGMALIHTGVRHFKH